MAGGRVIVLQGGKILDGHYLEKVEGENLTPPDLGSALRDLVREKGRATKKDLRGLLRTKEEE